LVLQVLRDSCIGLQIISGFGLEGQNKIGTNKPKQKDKTVIYLIFI